MIRKIFLFLSIFAFCSVTAQNDLKTVPSVNLDRYMGTWYEIARLQFPWEVTCAHNTQATYTKTGADTFDVANQCQTGEKATDVKISNGNAKVLDSKTNAKMKFTYNYFNRHDWVFNGEFWIIQLADDYSYVVMSTPQADHVMILSRNPTMPDNLYQEILDKLTLQLPNLNVLYMLKILQDTK